MCGIFFTIFNGELSVKDLENIQSYFNKIQYRGPDHSSSALIKSEKWNGLIGFHRLAIIDPSPESHPFLYDNGVYLTCNGEIYNYKHLISKYSLPVKTGSDCEVILQLYIHYRELWEDILSELDGVFAFVLYDENENKIVAGRDRFGVRPMFWLNDKYYSFASEGKAVYCHSKKDRSSVVPFKPGYIAFIDLNDTTSGNVKYKQWFKFGSYIPTSYITAQTVLKELFIDAVRKRLMSDRPVGFLVSGGLDSSLVASIASRLLGKKITTFSIGLPGSPDLEAAKKVADYLGSEHHEIIISTDDILQALPKVVYHLETYDITTIRASIPMYLISKYISEKTDIRVIFSGEGADELFGGYLYFHKAPSYSEFQNDTHRLLKELYKYDVLRGDRTTAGCGLEIRVPFLDATLVNFVANMDASHKMPGKNQNRLEKAILRNAFDGYLPHDILQRQKEAFSDGIGYNSVKVLKQWAELNKVENMIDPKIGVVPYTDESRYYYKLYLEHYDGYEGLNAEYYWLPKWTGVNDPSATFLDVHKLKN